MSDVYSVAEPIEVPTPIYEPNTEPLDEIGADLSEARMAENHEPFGSEGDDKDKEDQPVAVCGIAVIVLCLVAQVIVFILSVVATPLDVFRNKEPRSYIPDSSQRACFSMWGYKRCGPRRNLKDFNVGVVDVDIGLPADGFICQAFKSRLHAASAFSVVGIFFTLISIVFVVLAMCRILRTFIAGIFALLAMIFMLVCWACVCGTYYKSCEWSYSGVGLIIVNRTASMKDEYNYGASFGVMIAAWGVELLVAITLFVIN